MLIPTHPHDERLAALASGDPDAVADSALSDHVAACHRCTDTVAELGSLRASLAELPDLRPHRPLQLLPPVTDPETSRLDRAGGWARRFFAPVLTAGAALAMVGLVGTTAPLLGGVASQGAAPDAAEFAAPEVTHQRLSAEDDGHEVTGAAGAESGESTGVPAEMQPSASEEDAATLDAPESDGDQGATTVTPECSVWPMVLFTGVALMVAAALMRWIMVPRAG
jgi:anti-sigma factor RsiW